MDLTARDAQRIDAPPWWPPRVARLPHPPQRAASGWIYFSVFGVLLGGSFCGGSLALAGASQLAFATVGGVLLLLGLAAAALAARSFAHARRDHADALRRYQRELERQIPAWAQVVSSELGASRYRVQAADDETVPPLLSIEVALELLVHTAPPRSGYREGTAPQQLSTRRHFQPHVARLVTSGCWLEIAFDPASRTFVGQTLVTRDGRSSPLVDVDF